MRNLFIELASNAPLSNQFKSFLRTTYKSNPEDIKMSEE